MKCLVGKCDKTVTCFEITEDNAVVPAECEIGELRQLFSYFQYRAPNIESAKSPMLDFSCHEDVLHEITKGRDEFCFCNQNAKTEEELSNLALNGTKLCSWCKRFLCKRMNNPAKRDPSRRETDLECLLRHLRNAIAHGHVFVIHSGNYISLLLEDTNDNGNTTARIICCQADLKKWRAILEKAIKEHSENAEMSLISTH